MYNNRYEDDPNEGFRRDAEKLRGDWERVSNDLAPHLERFARGIARSVGVPDGGLIYLRVTNHGRTDEDRQARSQSNITPKKQQGLLSKLASIWSIYSSKLKLQLSKRS